MIDTADIEKRAELTRAQAIEIGTTIGGITIANPSDIEVIAQRLARGKLAVPPHCRDEPGVCFALCVQALEWKMPIMSVINKSYVANNRIAYESQLIHAIIERNAPLKGRLRSEIIGEGDQRRCKISGHFKGEKTPHEYTSETLGTLREARGRNPDKGNAVKGSPLWEAQPEVQLYYSATRTWARMFAPDVILGAYTPEDPWYSEDKMLDVSPQLNGLAQRLKDARKAAVDERGFDVDHVAKVIEGDATEAKDNEHKPREQQRRLDDTDGGDGHSDQEGSDSDIQTPKAPVADAARKPAARKESADLFHPKGTSRAPKGKR
jgi:RecT family